MPQVKATKHRKNNVAFLVGSILFGVLESVGIHIRMFDLIDTSVTYEVLDVTSKSEVFWRNFYISFSADRVTVLLSALALAGLFYIALQLSFSKSVYILAGVFGILFSFWQMTALLFQTALMGKNDALPTFHTLSVESILIFRAVYKYVALAAAATVFLLVLLWACETYLLQTEYSETRPNAKIYFASAGLFFLAMLPYFFLFYPGTSNEDTTIQLMQYFGIESYIHEMTPVAGARFTDHHPFLLTLLYGKFASLGLKMGSIERGIALFVILQMLFLSLVFAAGVCYLLHIGVSRNRVIFVQILVMLLPIYPMYAICVLKDVPFSAFTFLFFLMLFEIARTDGEVLEKKSFLTIMAFNALLMMLTKVYGKWLLIVLLIVLIIWYRRFWKQILVSLFLPLVLFTGVYQSLLLPALGVAPGGVQEALSVPFQQTARYVTLYGDEVTDDERTAIAAVLPYEKLSELYSPPLSDPVKKEYRQDASRKDLTRYFKTWARMFFKHPQCYIEATLANTYEYFEINKRSSLTYYEMNTYLQDHETMYPKEDYDRLYIENVETRRDGRYAVNQVMLTLEKTPVVNLFLSVGLLPWALFGILIFILLRHRARYILPLLVPMITVLICFVSPDNGNFRYVMPIFFCLPFLVVMLLVSHEREG